MTTADVHEVAAGLGVTVDPKDLDSFASMQRLVAIARQEESDQGTAMLAGLWLAQGLSENEIIRRLWPRRLMHLVRA